MLWLQNVQLNYKKGLQTIANHFAIKLDISHTLNKMLNCGIVFRHNGVGVLRPKFVDVVDGRLNIGDDRH